MADPTPVAVGQRLPASLLDGLDDAVCSVLQIRSLKHRSAALDVFSRAAPPTGLVETVYNVIADNWRRCRAQGPSNSLQNWRWRVPKLAIAPHNASPEVMLERAIVAACERARRMDVANQVPIASGIAGAFGERRRAIDLVREVARGRFEFIELKIASDTPLYAAVEIIGYTIIWLLSRGDAPDSANALLAASHIDARVRTPAAYYAGFAVKGLQAQLHAELAALGARQGVTLTFAFEAFDDPLGRAPFSDDGLLAVLDSKRAL